MSDGSSFFDQVKRNNSIKKRFNCYDCKAESPIDQMQRHILKRKDGTDGDMLVLCPSCKEGRNINGGATEGNVSTSRGQ